MAEYIQRSYIRKMAMFEMAYTMETETDVAVVLRMIDDAPAADVTPVVRCKDCKHYDMGVCLKIYSDGNVHAAAWQKRKPEDFCSYGERKDGANAEG